MVEHFSNLPALGLAKGCKVGGSGIVEQSFHILNGRDKCQIPERAGYFSLAF